MVRDQPLSRSCRPSSRARELLLQLWLLVFSRSLLPQSPPRTLTGPSKRHKGPENYIQVASTPTSSITVATTATAPFTMLPPQPHDSSALSSSETDHPMSNSVANLSLDFVGIPFNQPLTTLSDSDKFKLHIIGDSYMVLPPPRPFALLKKPPKIFVRATRSDRAVDVRLSKLFEGAYTLKLEREDAYGTMNVSV
jgi:hypothetical protein